MPTGKNVCVPVLRRRFLLIEVVAESESFFSNSFRRARSGFRPAALRMLLVINFVRNTSRRDRCIHGRLLSRPPLLTMGVQG